MNFKNCYANVNNYLGVDTVPEKCCDTYSERENHFQHLKIFPYMQSTCLVDFFPLLRLISLLSCRALNIECYFTTQDSSSHYSKLWLYSVLVFFFFCNRRIISLLIVYFYKKAVDIQIY